MSVQDLCACGKVAVCLCSDCKFPNCSDCSYKCLVCGNMFCVDCISQHENKCFEVVDEEVVDEFEEQVGGFIPNKSKKKEVLVRHEN